MLDTKLLTFLTVGEKKNLSKAAESLNITQPAVSQHIKYLEDYYNVKLLRREGRSIKLTAEGELLYLRAIELQRQSVQINKELANMHSHKKYNVGATLTIGGYVLPEIIGNYKKENNNIDIILHVENTETIIKKLFNADLELAIVEGPFDRSKVKYIKFKNDELVLVVSPEHTFAQKPYISIKDILKGELLLREKGSGTRKIFENKLEEQGYSLNDINVYMEIGDINALVSLVKSNLGYTIISKEAIKAEVQNNNLKIIPIKEFKIIREFNFIFLDEYHQNFKTNFINYCLSQYNLGN